MEHFNNLKPDELERLAILVEEAAEVQQIAMKIMRHGYESCHPDNEGERYTNRNELEKEIGHLQNITLMMFEADDIDKETVAYCRNKKKKSIQQYLHHQR